jgi:SAM-dependent methyltransferase
VPELPDLYEPRYRDEIGYFIAYEKYHWGTEAYPEARRTYSQTLMREVLEHLGKEEEWLRSQVVASIGCGCSGDLLTWPALVKIGVDPLLYAYQRLGMLGTDEPGTNPTVLLSVSAEDLPLLDDSADLVVCRNALDHMPHPPQAISEIARILKPDGFFFLGVDIGGPPTPDEPSVFSHEDEVFRILKDHFDVVTARREDRSYSNSRDFSLRIVACLRHSVGTTLDKEAVFRAYEQSWPRRGSKKNTSTQ